MIKVEYNNKTIKISGHAGFADFGKDIVCASVSSIIYTTVNGLLNIDSKSIKFKDNNNIIIIEILKNDNITNVLINNMIDLLNELEIQYPKNIKISKGE